MDWISVKDRLPQKNVEVLCAWPGPTGRYLYMVDQNEGDGWLSDNEGCLTMTHWMPLPPNPTQDKQPIP